MPKTSLRAYNHFTDLSQRSRQGPDNQVNMGIDMQRAVFVSHVWANHLQYGEGVFGSAVQRRNVQSTPILLRSIQASFQVRGGSSKLWDTTVSVLHIMFRLDTVVSVQASLGDCRFHRRQH